MGEGGPYSLASISQQVKTLETEMKNLWRNGLSEVRRTAEKALDVAERAVVLSEKLDEKVDRVELTVGNLETSLASCQRRSRERGVTLRSFLLPVGAKLLEWLIVFGIMGAVYWVVTHA